MEKQKKKISIEVGYHRSDKLQLRSPQSSINKNFSLNFEPKTTTASRTSLTKISSPKQLSIISSFNRLQRNSYYQASPSNSISSARSINSKPEISFPAQPKQIISAFPNDLNKLEQVEINEYQLVYFLGCSLKIKPTIDGNNYGYDDERGDYIITTGDHIAYRYEILKTLGKGSFGIVLECFDHKRAEKVALKIIKNKSRFHQQAAVEIKVLQQLRENDIEGKYNVVKIKNYFIFRKHICITFELLSLNLYELLRQNSFEGFSLTLIHRFAVQLLVCLQYIAKQGVIHCDLKPENILLKDTEKALINVIDFGSSCFENEKVYYYIQSRFYRAPEIILGISYTTAIDMWSLGCILVELYTGRPIFPGENEHIQLIYIMQVIGVPPEHLILKSKNKEKYFDSHLNPKIIENKKGVKKHPNSKPLADILQGSSDLFIDFISKCLCWDPEERLKPIDGLDHPWIIEGLKRKSKHV